jgi:hypothetical protein
MGMSMINIAWQIASDRRFFPTTLIVLNVCASMRYVADGDIRKAVYWFAAAVLTTSVTW